MQDLTYFPMIGMADLSFLKTCCMFSKLGFWYIYLRIVVAGQVVCILHNETDVQWGAKFDETVRQVWAMMEEYLNYHDGKDCRNLRSSSCCSILHIEVEYKQMLQITEKL